jgi:hypothetical protein
VVIVEHIVLELEFNMAIAAYTIIEFDGAVVGHTILELEFLHLNVEYGISVFIW